ncbi:MAG: thioredoxin family protein [Acidimicrobiia bacterium]|nr:thioredoxin family protein [Acidimicrobiia bacterium]
MPSSSTARPSAAAPLPDGLVAVVKRDCPTCELVVPVLAQLADGPTPLAVYTQDDPDFPAGLDPRDDTDLALSWHHGIETVPTLIKVAGGSELDRLVGWSREQWERFTGMTGLGPNLPEYRPGCGSLSVDPSLADQLAVRFGASTLKGRRVEFAVLEDEFEAAFDRGWTDGLPVVPPTEQRVMAMLEGTTRSADEIVADIPPDLHPATVEQVAINAVMAGCKPEYLPVVLAAVEAACTSEFNMHGLLATTYFSGPILVVNGPIAQRLGINSEGNTFGQGNRANLTIGRALQLVVRNLGGGRPGEVDMAMMGSPGKLAFCFAEREHDSPFEPLAVERGLEPDTDAVTVFAGSGPTAIVDQISRTPESLVRSMAACLRSVGHPKLAMGFDAMLVVSPEHGRIFAEAGWGRSRLRAELDQLLTIPGSEMVRGAGGIEEGLPEAFAESDIPKFRPGGLLIVHAGGDAGLFSAILDGWVAGAMGSEPVTTEIRP